MKKPEEIQIVIIMNEYSMKELKCRPFEYCLPFGAEFVADYQIELMIGQGFKKFRLIVDKKNDAIEEYFNKYIARGIELSFIYIDNVKRFSFRQTEGLGDFLLLPGNVFMDIDFQEMLYRYGSLGHSMEFNLYDLFSHQFSDHNKIFEINSSKSYLYFRKYVLNRFGQARPAVFLDRDGVINEIVYNEDTEQMDSPFKKDEIILVDGALEAISKIKEMGYLVFIVTNQPAAAKGKVTLGTLYDVNRYLLEMLKPVEIEDIFMCPHYPEKGKFVKEEFLIQKCDCRKPKPGLLYQGRQKYAVDWKNSYMIGDSYTDVAAGATAGVHTVFIGNYKCDVCKQLEGKKPDYICRNLSSFSKLLKIKINGGGEDAGIH